MVRALPELFLLSLLVAGCAPVSSFSDSEPAFRTVLLGRSARGLPIDAYVFPGTRPGVFILGGIHGSESAGAALVAALVQGLVQHPEWRAGREVVLIPRANPDGLEAHTRTNANGVDLNRNFATRNFRPRRSHGDWPLSEPETRVVTGAVLRYQPSCVISVHAPLGCIDPDGGSASQRLAQELAAVSGLPVRDLPTLPGSMGTYVGIERNLTMITYELDRPELPPSGLAAYLRPHLIALAVAIHKG